MADLLAQQSKAPPDMIGIPYCFICFYSFL